MKWKNLNKFPEHKFWRQSFPNIFLKFSFPFFDLWTVGMRYAYKVPHREIIPRFFYHIIKTIYYIDEVILNLDVPDAWQILVCI